MQTRIKDIFEQDIQTKLSLSAGLPDKLQQSSELLVNCLLQGNKIIVYGNGRALANAQFMVANLVNRYHFARPSFPAIHLALDGTVGSAISTDNSVNEVYQKQFNIIAQENDILVIFLPVENQQILQHITLLIQSAKDKNINIIVLTGKNYTQIEPLLRNNDIILSIPLEKEPRILEHHLFISNTLCELIEYKLFSQ